MWIFTTIGFFSIVHKPGTDFLTVCARVASDLDNLRTRFMPQLSPTIKGGGTDYPCFKESKKEHIRCVFETAYGWEVRKDVRQAHSKNYETL